MRYLIGLIVLQTSLSFAACGAGVNTNRITINGTERSFVLHWPGDRESAGLPAVIVLHGGGNAGNMAAMTNWNAKADTERFVVVYPNGTGRFQQRFLTWNAGNCCGYARKESVDDIKFFDRLIEELKQKYKVDSRRIFMTG